MAYTKGFQGTDTFLSSQTGLVSLPIRNVLLVTRFSDEEIFKADALSRNQALGPDGFTTEFLVKHWSKLKGSFKNLFDDFHRNGRLNACV